MALGVMRRLLVARTRGLSLGYSPLELLCMTGACCIRPLLTTASLDPAILSATSRDVFSATGCDSPYPYGVTMRRNGICGSQPSSESLCRTALAQRAISRNAAGRISKSGNFDDYPLAFSALWQSHRALLSSRLTTPRCRSEVTCQTLCGT